MNRSKTPVSSLVVLTAGAMALLLIDTRHAGDPLDIYSLNIEGEGSDAGGTDVKTTEAQAEVIAPNAGEQQAQTGGNDQQMQAQASDTAQVGGQLSAKAETDDTSVLGGSDAGLGKTDIKDPSAGNDQTQQV